MDHGEKVHQPKKQVDVFRGNMVFASINQLSFMSTSRRDDLISLCYLLIFCINKGKIPGVDAYGQGDKNEQFHIIRKAKLKHNIKVLCNEKDSTIDLTDFVSECFSYRYKDKPNYAKLRAILEGLIEFEDFSDSDEEELKEPLEELKKQKIDSDEFMKPEPVNKIVKTIMKDLKDR